MDSQHSVDNQARYRAGAASLSDLVRTSHAAASAQGDPVFISVVGQDLLDEVTGLAGAGGINAPLAGLTFAIKDNIDFRGMPTTAACPSFDRRPDRSATVVAQLILAGAVPVGKTNLDQFATGLVGTRSPYGALSSVAGEELISGGSSSGSAIAVARGIVDFALGTDTAGSGRIPAGFNGIVGLKPTRGRLSTAGVLPACRSLDCVSVFARDVDTAALVLEALDLQISSAAQSTAAGSGLPTDPLDSFSRGRPAGRNPAVGAAVEKGSLRRVAVDRDALGGRGDAQGEAAWRKTIGMLEDDPATELVEIDIAPYVAVGDLLYAGPWVAERYASVGDFLETEAEGIDPTVRSIILGGKSPRAVDAFEAAYRLSEARAALLPTMSDFDAILVPTAVRHPTHAEVEREPVAVNSELGRFTNFVNLMDLCALAVPGPAKPDGRPFGVTLISRPWRDELLLEIGARIGRLVSDGPDSASLVPMDAGGSQVDIALAGAHMTGLAANQQVRELGGSFKRITRTASAYALRLLDTPVGQRPGLVRPEGASAALEGRSGQVEVEVWSLDSSQLGRLAEQVPAGLSLGPVELLDGSSCLGFVAAAAAVGSEARYLRSGWRDHLQAGHQP